MIAFLSAPIFAENLRVAMWHSEYSRKKGPGLLIKDLLEDADIFAHEVEVMRQLQPDFLVLTDVDQDDEGWAGELLAQKLGFSNYHLLPTNRGVRSGFDLNHDGWIDENDRQGFGYFRGQHSMLLLSNIPRNGAQSFNQLLFRDFSKQPSLDGSPYYSPEAWEALKLTPTGLWDFDFGGFHLLMAYANTPAFDGEERRNVMRNAAEIRWWNRYISGESFVNDEGLNTHLDGAFILAGTLNLDPEKGKGERDAIVALLSNPRLNPVETERRETVDWSAIDLGEMRVDYILPSCHFEILNTGQIDMKSEHALLYADLKLHENCNFP